MNTPPEGDQSPPPASLPDLRSALVDAISEGLRGTWHCTRVWEAWDVGTMSEDDFVPVDETDTPAELTAAVLALVEPMLASERAKLHELHRQMERQVSNLRRDLELRGAYERRDYWGWQGDGTDHPESMGSQMAVMMTGAQLRELLASPPVALQELKTLHDKTAELIAHLQATGRLRPCFNLPALESARAVIEQAGGELPARVAVPAEPLVGQPGQSVFPAQQQEEPSPQQGDRGHILDLFDLYADATADGVWDGDARAAAQQLVEALQGRLTDHGAPTLATTPEGAAP